LEIGGSHAHRLRPLIEKLGLLTLVVTDLDASLGVSSAQPARGAGQVTGNATLKTWLPQRAQVDELLDLEDTKKVAIHDPIFAVRAAYQYPVNVDIGGKSVEVIPSTFEDALAFANLATFGALEGTTGLMEKFRQAIADHKTGPALSKALYDHLHSSSAKKAEFALDLLALEDPERLEIPIYLSEGLSWLQDQLRGKHVELLPIVEDGDAAGAAA
ncbi:MAG: ATP-dependent endonuclease, partial [Verrucomicrobiota bacterium]|nr:ATP-dependent endonuclease [Verrucomicrobiota bacterium]